MESIHTMYDWLFCRLGGMTQGPIRPNGLPQSELAQSERDVLGDLHEVWQL